MPFVTVVTLGASSATDFLSTTAERSRLTGIREMSENDLYDDYPFSKKDPKKSKSGVNIINHEELGCDRKRSKSVVDLRCERNLDKLISSSPPTIESGYNSGSPISSSGCSSSISSSSSSSCGSDSTDCGVGLIHQRHKLEDDDILPCPGSRAVQLIHQSSTITLPPVVANNHGYIPTPPLFIQSANSVGNNSKLSLGGGGAGNVIQGKANIWKTWIRQKLNLTKNGKYSFQGSSTVLGQFGIKAVMKMMILLI